jgi:TorA maturation chaperone TorD
MADPKYPLRTVTSAPSPIPMPALGSDARAALSLWADVLGLLARLHDREVDHDLLDGLRGLDLAEVLSALLPSDDGQKIAQGFVAMLEALPTPADAAYLDELAADFADIYLNHGFRAAPTGSVWMSEDHLERQQPMFDVRDWYQHYGITVPNWRLRSDDHIANELQFVQHLLGLGTAEAAFDAARFLDQHVLPWVPEFNTRVAGCAREPFHAMANLLTRAALEALRALLEDITGVAPLHLPNAWQREASRDARAAAVEAIERPFMPGLAESW